MTRQLFGMALGAVLALGGASCHREAQWKIKGTVEGSQNETVVLESSFNGNWYAVDSTRTNASGAFSFAQPAPQNPGIYRLTYMNRQAYFPVDSIETLTFSSNAATFGTDYSVSGSPAAEMFNNANKLLASSRTLGEDSVKRALAQLILQDPSGLTAYYIINSSFAPGKPVFSTADKKDLRVIGAVANAYNDRRPGDPRTAYLKNLYLQARSSLSTRQPAYNDTIVAVEVAMPDLELMDETGAMQKLSDFTGNGPVLLSFTQYTAEYSPALNVILGQLYEKHAAKGLKIYQVGFDPDEYQWRESARNLPWTTVFNTPKEGASTLMKFNVLQLPTVFIIDRQGELAERVNDPNELPSLLSKYL